MNIDFILAAAETFYTKAKRAEEEGKLSFARENYRLAAAKYRAAAEALPERRGHYTALALECERRAAGAAAPAPAPAKPDKKPRPAPSGQGEQEGEKKPARADGSAPEYSGYDLNFKSPNEKVSFDDIIGLDSAKTAIHRKLIYPLLHPEAYRKYHIKPGGNILLEGPPGTGKTTFAKAAACEVDLPFVVVDCNALVDCYIGNTGKNIDKMFEEVRRFVREQKTAVLLFCDEFDAIAKARTSDDKTAAEAVPTLIRQLDGFDTDNANIVILAATNLKTAIDPAILSRFGNSIYIPLPDEDARRKIFASKLEKWGVSAEDIASLDLFAAASCSEGMSGRDINSIVGDLSGVLAERDGGITPLTEPLQDVLLRLIDQKRKGL